MDRGIILEVEEAIVIQETEVLLVIQVTDFNSTIMAVVVSMETVAEVMLVEEEVEEVTTIMDEVTMCRRYVTIVVSLTTLLDSVRHQGRETVKGVTHFSRS